MMQTVKATTMTESEIFVRQYNVRIPEELYQELLGEKYEAGLRGERESLQSITEQALKVYLTVMRKRRKDAQLLG